MSTITIDAHTFPSTLSIFTFHIAMAKTTTCLLLGALLGGSAGASATFAAAPDGPSRATQLTCMLFAFAFQLLAVPSLGVIEHYARFDSPAVERFVVPALAFLLFTIVSIFLMFASFSA
ncbi:hypothetical protein FRB90_011380 [Tulasnella sp. 427]|nr:hypothetical protein FRB90_011380 [Tulasnella sp. 427]